MITPGELQQRLETFHSDRFNLQVPTASELHGYQLLDLDRDSGALHEAFYYLDGKGPKYTLAELCARQNTVTVLDAGCGTGNQLVSLFQQTIIIEGVEPERLLGDAVSDYDFSRFGEKRRTRVALGAGLVNYAVLDLAAEKLPPSSYDLAYSYEVHLHNKRPERIIDNVFQSLKPGGVMYFNTDGRQLEQVNAHVKQYRQSGTEVLSGEIIPTYGWLPPNRKHETRHAFKLTRPLA